MLRILRIIFNALYYLIAAISISFCITTVTLMLIAQLIILFN